MQTQTEAFRRKRKFFLVLPLLVLPFLTMAFWALGGGKTAGTAYATTPRLSLQLPGPQLKEKKGQDKLALYNRQQQATRRQAGTAKQGLLQRLGFQEPLPGLPTDSPATLAPPSGIPGSAPETNEEKIKQRLTQLNGLLQQEPPAPALQPGTVQASPAAPPGGGTRFSRDVQKLETLMQTMDSPAKGASPEMQQLEGMLERILDIQHPERVSERLRLQSQQNRQQVLPLQALPPRAAVTLLTTLPVPGQQGSNREPAAFPGAHDPHFHGLDSEQSGTAALPGSLEAVVHGTQTLSAGTVAKVRLLQDAFLDGRLIPRGTLLHGTCRLSGERLLLDITAIRTGDALLPVALKAYDLDGLEGIHAPGALHQQASAQAGGGAISQALQFPPGPASLGAQVAETSLEAAKGLFLKKTKRIKVTVPAGYRLLLQDKKNRH